jgi:uncharacterized protein (TIGR01440 family)
MLQTVFETAKTAAAELIDVAKLQSGDILVVGCSSSEVGGEKIGTHSSVEVGKAVFDGIYAAAKEKGVLVAAQCCEHLNRAIIIEADGVKGQDIVNVVPQPKAGGAFATAAYQAFSHPVAVEDIKADAGMDIGNTLIGMHLKKVAVPVRLTVKQIGNAPLVCARTRPKCIGGERAVYDPTLG